MRQRPTVGVLLPYVGGCYFATLLGGILRAAREHGARVVAFQTAGMDLFWASEPDTSPLGWERIDGWIGINDRQGTAYYERIAAAGKPLVLVSARLAGQRGCAVLPDNGGVRLAVHHLVEHGHRRIAFAGALSHTDVRERYEGYLAGLREAGITPDPSLFFPMAGLVELDGQEVGRKLVAARIPCTAIVACTDASAIGIMDAIQAAGHRIPEDLAVMGFDDIEGAQYTNPPLSTVHMPFDVVAQRGAEALLARLLKGTPLPGEIRVAGTLVPRRSCGCARRQELLLPRASEAEPSESLERERFTAALVALASGGRAADAATEQELRPDAALIAAHLAALVRGEPGISASELHEAWQRLLKIAHEVETVDGLLSLLEETTVAWHRRAAADPDTLDFARAALRNLRFELMRAWRIVEQTRRRFSDASGEANRKINRALIEGDSSAQELSWLRWAWARHATLGEWRPRTSEAPRRLHIRSVYGAGADPVVAVNSEHLPAAFPSAALCAVLDDAGPTEILSVVPITGREGHNRGLMTVVAPIEAEFTDDTGNLAQWAALLSAAMDREDLLASLRLAVDRERDFAETLRRSEERYALAAHGANDGLWDWDVASGRVYFSPRWKSMLGCEDHEVGSDLEAWFSRVLPEDLPRLQRTLDAHLGDRKPHLEHEYRMVHEEGRQVWVLCRGIVLFDSQGRPVRVAGSQTDITGRKETEEQIRRSAMHDALTGLPNRALLIDRLEQAIARAERTDKARFAILFLDLDHFKTINDSLGHVAGDRLLLQIANRLTECLRSIDTVARLGGDEFAIIVTDLENDETASLVAVRIHEALRAPFDIGSHRVFTSASIGITLSSERHQRAEDYIRDADTAMYRAKSEGRSRHQLFDGRMHEQAVERLAVEAGVRRALERDEFLLHYQPIVSLDTGSVVGVEALIRWNHPERGVLLPAAFLAVAEECGLILPMSDWVMRSACDQARAWQDELPAPVRLSVNLPSQQLKDAHLVEVVRENLRRTQLDPSALGLELVESSLIEHGPTIVDNLQQLRAMGIYIAVDDFGTGYSSLSYLKRLPIDALKIDRSFTQGIPHDPNDTAISTAIIAMARSLNLQVVAEGVETREQSEFLRAHGCQTAQGYLFSRPLPAAECLAYLRRAREPRRPSYEPLASSVPRL